MFPSRAWSFVAVLLAWPSWSSLLVAADKLTTHQTEVNALLEIKKSLIDVNNSLSNWNRGDPCKSNWVGVLCNETAMKDGYLHVIELHLLNMNLSGHLSPYLGLLSHLEILDFMWNKINGSIPKEIGNIKPLKLLLLSGNRLTGSLSKELGDLPNLERIQIDENQISGPIPESFANLNKTQHFHMNNNQINGQIPAELFRLPSLRHFILDNNNLSGHLPPEFSRMKNLAILQLDNNNFGGTAIPDSYSNLSKVLKLSLRNCNLQGPIPDLSRIPSLFYVDLSSNQLDGFIPPERLSLNITTIDLSNNNLTGTIPDYFSALPYLQKLFLANNSLSGSIPSSIWQNRTVNETERLTIDFENNNLTNILGSFDLPLNVTLRLGGNPVCSNTNLANLCGSQREEDDESDMNRSKNQCPQCQSPFEYSRTSPLSCFCAVPLRIGYRLKSPGFSYFIPYRDSFKDYLIKQLGLHLYQLEIESFEWQEGPPRLVMVLKIFPESIADNSTSNIFNASEAERIKDMFTRWRVTDTDLFGPREFLNTTLHGQPASPKSALSIGALVGIILAGVAAAATLSAIVSLLIVRAKLRGYHILLKRHGVRKHPYSMNLIKINGVKSFTYSEMALATNNFSSSSEVGQGGYGKVYKGILDDGLFVAVKRAKEGSLQGQREFLNEIEFLSRLHHRNLVSLVGYCAEEGEQMLVYEFMSRGTLRDQLSDCNRTPHEVDAYGISARSQEPLGFAMRLSIALASAKGILYLHTEADPPVIHRDIKSTNILLDHKFTAKVADFGLSKLAPVPNTQGIVPSHVSTVVKGTPGYLDPEYFRTHQLTDKSDVYSLGVVFLELLTGMRPIAHQKNIVREVTTAYQSGMISSMIDGRMSPYPPACVENFMTLALKCCNDETESRPSMAEVYRELENIWLSMPESEIRITEFVTCSDHTRAVGPPSSSSSSSQNVSCSNNFSGVISTITPR